MNLVKLKTVDYPESDGCPMGETDDHREAMVRVIELLKNHYHGQKVYVSGDLLVYYEQGNAQKFVVPDAFVAKGIAQSRRRVYRLWVEGVVPQVVIETTSKSTRIKDTTDKPQIFAKLGVCEYFLHDPTGEYLEPSLQGYRLHHGEYVAIEPDSQGGLFSKELGLVLRITEGELNFFDAKSSRRLLTNAESANVEAEARQVEAEARQRAEAEVARLQAELARLQRPDHC
ncbi:MAG: Uma2 family endonuclease [Planctomycetaceae bacterium]|nr:Uma2 family endonuclease [Planctomycetaceae bacterium]